MTAKKPETTCLCCNHTFEGNYCPHCGEKAGVRRLSWRTLGDDLLYSFTNMDRGFVFTVRELFSRPGHMMREYLAGRRRCYFRPFAMLVLLAGAYLILATLLFPDFNPMVGVNLSGEQTAPSPSREVLEILFGHPAAFSLLLLLGIAWVTPLVFRKNGGRKYNYIEYLFIGAYMTSQRFLVDIALLPYKLIPESAGWPDEQFLIGLAYIGLTAWNYKQLFGLRWRGAIPKTIWLMVLASIPTIILLFLIVGAVLLVTGDQTLINEVKHALS